MCKSKEELTTKERDIVDYLKWYSELDTIPEIITKAENQGILTTEEKRRLYKLNLRKLLGIEEDESKIELNSQLERTRYGGITKSL